MSRIGRMPITVPAGVTVTVEEGNFVTVKGPKGTLTQQLHGDMIIKQEAGIIEVQRPSEIKKHKALHGLTRTLLNNMVILWSVNDPGIPLDIIEYRYYNKSTNIEHR